MACQDESGTSRFYNRQVVNIGGGLKKDGTGSGVRGICSRIVLIVNKDNERRDILDETRRAEDKYNENITPAKT